MRSSPKGFPLQSLTQTAFFLNHPRYNLAHGLNIRPWFQPRLLVFSNQDWQEISDTTIDWENIIRKITNKSLAQKLERVSPLVSQDVTTRYLEFIEKYPTLVNRIPLSYIASYLGITQQSLRKIRKNIK